MAASLRMKCVFAASASASGAFEGAPRARATLGRRRYPNWVLEDMDWMELNKRMGDDD